MDIAVGFASSYVNAAIQTETLTESSLMFLTVTLFLVLTIPLLALVLAREVRWRLALERLLRRLLTHFYLQAPARESIPLDSTSAADDDSARRL